jgi:hypothetical protein
MARGFSIGQDLRDEAAGGLTDAPNRHGGVL